MSSSGDNSEDFRSGDPETIGDGKLLGTPSFDDDFRGGKRSSAKISEYLRPGFGLPVGGAGERAESAYDENVDGLEEVPARASESRCEGIAS